MKHFDECAVAEKLHELEHVSEGLRRIVGNYRERMNKLSSLLLKAHAYVPIEEQLALDIEAELHLQRPQRHEDH